MWVGKADMGAAFVLSIVCRGNRRDPLFKEANDFRAFLYILEQLHENIPFEIASYCLMTNHFHLQARSQQQSISKVMALVNKRYANYYNTRYGLTGHVFEKRYFSKIIDDDAGMLEVSRYIHLNPVRHVWCIFPNIIAGVVSTFITNLPHCLHL